MNEKSSTSDRVYDGVKAELLRGAFLPGGRLDAAILAMRFKSSITPVRAALHRLVGERLVDAHVHEGFHAPRVTEPALRDLYDWNLQQLIQVLQVSARGRSGLPRSVRDLSENCDVVTTTERLFLAIANLSGNAEYRWAIHSANDRLHAVRRFKIELVADWDVELQSLVGMLGRGDFARLEQGLITYHVRRQKMVPDLVRVLHQPRPNGRDCLV